ncbi:MAG: VIT and vWA domain-containing protein [Gammaproteobacteria bacterium]
MKLFRRVRQLGLLCILASATLWASANAAGLLTPSDGSLPALGIKNHEVDVVIEHGYAITTVEQVFANPHARDLEAIYSFPVPEHGAVAEFTVWIDGQPVIGEVLEKAQARRVYEEEKAAGREAGLTEKDGYKTFDIHVSPVRAGQDTRIRLVYLQATHVDTGIGRYVYPLEEGGVDEQKLAFWTADEAVSEHFEFALRLRSAYPVEAMRVPNHTQALVQQTDTGNWQVMLETYGGTQAPVEEGGAQATQQGFAPANPVAFRLDSDVAVYWRHQAGLPGSVDLIAYKPEAGKRGTFMMTVTPGDDLKPITEGRDWIFVLDMSGSMQGKYATLADGVERALGKLQAHDRFRIVLFNSTTRELTHGFVPVTVGSVQQYSQQVAAIVPSESTNLFAGLRLALDSLDADRSTGIVLVTDGVANVGETRQREFIRLMQSKDVRLFTFIMGNSANRPLLETLTNVSNGFALSVSNSDDIVGQLLSATSKLNHEAMHGVKLKIKGVKTADLSPDTARSLYRGEQLIVFGHYFDGGTADVTLQARISGQPVVYRTQFDFPETVSGNPEIERLWAYSRIEHMTAEMENFGEKPDMKQALIDLGVEYGLVTDYTSMVVMREEQFAARGIEQRNAKRRAVETAAQSNRAQQAVQPSRVDNARPMFSSGRSSHSRGGGALGPLGMAALIPLVVLLRRRRTH